MDFIERIFNVSPDDGSGSLEVIILIAIGALLLGLFLRARSGRRPGSPVVVQPPVIDPEHQSTSLKGLAQEIDRAAEETTTNKPGSK